MEEFPGNSRTGAAKAATPDQHQRPTQVTTGKVIVAKPSLGKRFKGAFVGEDGRNVATHVLWDVVIPMGRDLLADAGRAMIDQVIYGESRSRPSRPTNYNSVGSTLASRINYSKPAFMTDPRTRPDQAKAPTAQTRGHLSIDDIILEHRAEADVVIDSMRALCERFGQATIADLFDLVGQTGEFTDVNFGWLNVDGARPHRVRDGYRLDFPRPIQL